MGFEQSRRERKTARTRETIISAARRLFLEQGFDRTTIEDVARAADVAVQTVFNHVASKEELFFVDRMPAALTLSATLERGPGETWSAAVVRVLTDASIEHLRALEDPELLDVVAQVEVVPALARYERTVQARVETALADNLLAAGLTARPRWAAALLLATARVFSHEHRQQVIAGSDVAEALDGLAAELARHLADVLALVTEDARV